MMRMQWLPVMLAVTAVFCTANLSNAQFSLTGTTYSENFDGLPTTGTTALSSATVGVQSALPGTQFVATKNAGNGTTFSLIADDGSSVSGSIRSLGVDGSADRSLGTLASGSTTPTFGIQIVNNTGNVISSVDLSGLAVQFRSSTVTQNIINFQFFVGDGTGAVTGSNFLTAAGFTDLDSFDLVGAPPVATNGAITPTSTPIQGTITGDIAQGSSLFLRFVDFNDGGSDAALGLNNFSLTANFTPVPEPATILGLAAAGLGALRMVRRRAIG